MTDKEKTKLRKAHVADSTKLDKRIDEIIAGANTFFGEEIVIRMSKDGKAHTPYGGYSTGYQYIDDILTGHTDDKGVTISGSGIGFPKGRMIEIAGPEAAGKTSLGLMAVADCQRKGGIAAFADVEHAIDIPYARFLGVDTDSLLLSQPNTAEDALEFVKLMVKKKVDIVVLDSVAALVPRAELEGDFRGKHGGMALQAQLMSKACRRLTALLKNGGPSIIWINQIRQKVGVMFGNPEYTPGGNALKFYASIRCDLRKVKLLKKGNNPIGVVIKMKTIKNKCARPFREVWYKVTYNEGIEPTSKAAEFKKEKDDGDSESGD